MEKETKKPQPQSQVIIYKAETGETKIDVRFDGETVWLSQKQMADLFDCTSDNIGLHLKNIFKSSELSEYSVAEDFSVTASDGKIYKVKHFFKTVQNKVHYAITGSTAAEIIANRVDSKKPNIGLTNFRGAKPTKEEVAIAKNYLNEQELLVLNNLVEQYLVFAEGQAMQRIPMKMDDWIEKLHGFLTINNRKILKDAGKTSHELAVEIAEKNFDEYKKIEAKNIDNGFDKAALHALEIAKKKKGKNKNI